MALTFFEDALVHRIEDQGNHPGGHQRGQKGRKDPIQHIQQDQIAQDQKTRKKEPSIGQNK